LSTGEILSFDSRVVGLEDIDCPGVVLVSIRQNPLAVSIIVPNTLTGIKSRLRGENTLPVLRDTVYPVVKIKEEALDGRKTASMNALKRQIQTLETVNNQLTQNNIRFEGQAKASEAQLSLTVKKVESLQSVINLLKSEAAERTESLHASIVGLRKAEHELALKKEGLAKAQKDNLAAKVRFGNQIDMLRKQVEYWKTLQIRSANETDAEAIVTAAALKDPATKAIPSIVKLAGIKKQLVLAAEEASKNDETPMQEQTTPQSEYTATVKSLKIIVTNSLKEFTDMHSTDNDWTRSLGNPLLELFDNPLVENDEFSIVSSPPRSIA